jgi:hypothetical protein
MFIIGCFKKSFGIDGNIICIGFATAAAAPLRPEQYKYESVAHELAEEKKDDISNCTMHNAYVNPYPAFKVSDAR